MNRNVTISLKALIVGGLLAVLVIVGAFKIMSIEKSIGNAALVIQVQQNSQNIQALDRALTKIMKDIEEQKGK
ncbi:MAG: hypothetical protein ACYDH3_00020 [Candidatus Aminicenantales bacterium]